MKIRKISCTQFAGMRDKDISFEDGINIVYGKNESGKSTLVNLISRTLFQSSKIDGRSDKEFCSLYFPSKRRNGGEAGDFLDGKIAFETEDGAYELSKVWGEGEQCVLSSPNGAVRAQKRINEELRDALVYGEGVYTDMLLSSQRNSDASLQTLLDVSRKTDAKQEIVNAAALAFAESGGVTVDAVGDAIAERIKEIGGSHWDFERGAPMRKSGRWASGCGEILKAYYALEDAQAVLNEISALEERVDAAAEEYAKRDAEAAKAERAAEEFGAFVGRLTVQSERRSRIKAMEQDMKKYGAALEEWPVLASQLDAAEKIRAEKESRELTDKYNAVKKLDDEVNACREKLSEAVCPSAEEIAAVKKALREIATLENKLCGMNMAARIRMLGENAVEITALRTGERLNIGGERLEINEAVNITIPDVMEMTLTPSDVNADEVRAEIDALKQKNEAVYEKYGAQSAEGLEELAAAYAAAKAALDAAQSRLTAELAGSDYGALKAAVSGIDGTVRERAEIDGDIDALCQGADIARFIAVRETLIGKNEADYGSIEELKARTKALSAELEKARLSLGAAEDIPPEYMKLANPEQHAELLRNTAEAKRREREAVLTEKTAASSRLESYRETLDGDAAENTAAAERSFNEKKELLGHWKHIEEVFNAKKSELSENPMQDIAENFTRYLGIISGGRVDSELDAQDGLDMNIYSNDRLLDYGKLSEGTKETVSLAFRLAVLEHLFPEGGGVVVLDDPLTDMDAERSAQSCGLVKEAAKKHQVIFLTCKEEYIDMLGGNIIRM